MSECEDACYKISGIYPCDLREALLESDTDHSKKIECRAAYPTLDAYINNVKTHTILIATGAEISAISENFIKKNNRYFKNTAILRTNKLQIQTADKNKTVATGQVNITLKYDELEVNTINVKLTDLNNEFINVRSE